jgi:hypothetical protein
MKNDDPKRKLNPEWVDAEKSWFLWWMCLEPYPGSAVGPFDTICTGSEGGEATGAGTEPA